MTIRVLLVDDQELIRVGFRMILDSQQDMEVVGEASDGLDALEQLKTLTVDVVLMDVRMEPMDGVEATRRICRSGGPRVVVLTTFDLDEYAYQALEAGASGFLLKNAPLAEITSAIRYVHSGDAVVAPSTTKRLLARFVHKPDDSSRPVPGILGELTPREREVLAMLADGLSNGEIAERLFVAETTVKTHVGRILTKLGLRDRVQAVVFAYKAGLI
ncbi:response regulator transcription factor [Nocardia transvalensis]|uniref:response regulator transcription factor n=1 Tax=Nocardia transvalensis TaxID=37333 RepID=UPI00189450BF|nr:response regulator transcription factor [Nocardia transvalensis]MBF6332540.1 response regulator transcription factor [Nocardia transvalensis]